MGYIRIMGGLTVLVATLFAIFLLYRRTNILLEQFSTLNNELVSIKNFLRKGPVRTSGPAVNIPLAQSTVAVGAVTGNNIQQEQEQPIEEIAKERVALAQNNINMLKSSIENLENMISSSEEESEYSDTEESDEEALELDGADDEEIEIEVSGEDMKQTLEELELDNKNITSYDLTDNNEPNSELEVLANNPDLSKLLDTLSIESANPQESEELTPITQNLENITKEIKAAILEKYSKRELENLCAKHSLSKSGNKKVLIERLLESGHTFSKISSGAASLSEI